MVAPPFAVEARLQWYFRLPTDRLVAATLGVAYIASPYGVRALLKPELPRPM